MLPLRQKAISLWVWPWENRKYDVLRVLLAVVLLSAAALKGSDLLEETLQARFFWDSRAFLIFLVLLEFGFGLWLLFELYPQWSRWAAVGLFLVFLEFSLIQGLIGQKTCRCLGKVEISPWVMFGFDAMVVWCLLVLFPKNYEGLTAASAPWRLKGFLGFYFFVGIPAGVNMVFYTPRGPMLQLRTDKKIGILVPVDFKSPSTEQILDHLGKATGLRMTIDPEFENSRPDYGRVGPTKMKVWSVMEFVAQKQPVGARWKKMEDGYHLSNAAPFGSLFTPWLISAGLGCALLIGAGIWVIHGSQQTPPLNSGQSKCTVPPGAGR